MNERITFALLFKCLAFKGYRLIKIHTFLCNLHTIASKPSFFFGVARWTWGVYTRGSGSRLQTVGYAQYCTVPYGTVRHGIVKWFLVEWSSTGMYGHAHACTVLKFKQ